MGTFWAHSNTMHQFRSSKISHTLKKMVLNGYFCGHTICGSILKMVLNGLGHTQTPCSSVLKNGSKCVLSGYTISPCHDQAFPSATMTLVNFHIVSGGAAPWTKLSPPVSFRSSINSHIVKKWVFERERERGRGRGGERERVAPPVTFRYIHF